MRFAFGLLLLCGFLSAAKSTSYSLGGITIPQPINGVYSFLAAGVTIPVDDTNISVGLVTVPLGALCKFVANGTCRVCNIDCVVAHNATSGQCVLDTATGQYNCLCIYDTPSPVTRPATSDVCGSYEVNPDRIPQIDAAIDAVVQAVLRFRYQTLLCAPLSLLPDPNATCAIECQKNHAAKSGSCYNYVPNDYSLSQGWCICSY